MTAAASERLRRRSLLGAGAALLAAGSCGLSRATSAAATAGLSAQEQALWQLSLSLPDGSMLALASLKGRPTLLNFWATWCPPCIEELPLLNAFYAENQAKGWQVLGVAVDQVAPVKRFLAQKPLLFPVVMAGMDGVALSRSLGNVSGGLPFSVVLGPEGAVWRRKIGRLSPRDLQAWQSGAQAR